MMKRKKSMMITTMILLFTVYPTFVKMTGAGQRSEAFTFPYPAEAMAPEPATLLILAMCLPLLWRQKR